MKIFNLAILTLLISTSLAGSCAHNCQLCRQTGSGSTCGVCFRKVNDDGTCNGDGPANCDVPFSSDFCFRCSEGYIVDTTTGQCQASTIQNCASGRLENGKQTCEFCVDSSPTPDYSSCSGASMIPNCLWEGLFNGDSVCARCKAGYSAQFNRCVIQIFRGCMDIDQSGYCIGCDVYNGWFMTAPGVCAQGSEDRNKRLFFSRR